MFASFKRLPAVACRFCMQLTILSLCFVEPPMLGLVSAITMGFLIEPDQRPFPERPSV